MTEVDRDELLDNASELTHDDRHLVDLVDRVLVDPNLHTDLRMRLQRELTRLLRDTRQKMSPQQHADDRERETAGHDHQPVDLLASVLVDPNLHTDLRMRLHREIRELLNVAHGAAIDRAAATSGKEQR